MQNPLSVRTRRALKAGMKPLTVAQTRAKIRALGIILDGEKPASRGRSEPSERLLFAKPSWSVLEFLAAPYGKSRSQPHGVGQGTVSHFHGIFSRACNSDGQSVLSLNHWWGDGDDPDDGDKVLARQDLGQLFLWTTSAGLMCRARVPDTTLGRIVLNKLDRGEVNGVSAAIDVSTRSYGDNHTAAVECHCLREISILTDDQFPAFDGTAIKRLYCSPRVSVGDPDFRDHATTTAKASARLRLVGVGGSET